MLNHLVCSTQRFNACWWNTPTLLQNWWDDTFLCFSSVTVQLVPHLNENAAMTQAACLRLGGSHVSGRQLTLLLKMIFPPLFPSCSLVSYEVLSWLERDSHYQLEATAEVSYFTAPSSFPPPYFIQSPPHVFVPVYVPFFISSVPSSHSLSRPVLHPACLSLSPPSPPLCHLISRINGFISMESPWWWIMSLIIISPGWQIRSLIRSFFSGLKQHVKESKTTR